MYLNLQKISDILVVNKYTNTIKNEINNMSMQDGLYLDYNFEPHKKNICDEKDFKKIACIDKIEWTRISNFFNDRYCLFKNFESNNINQGQLNNSYLISTICCLAEFNNGILIKRIFENNNINENSIYGIWFFIDGLWQLIIIDDYIPSFKNGLDFNFIFSSTNNNDIWVMLLEKAFAKLKKNYFNLNNGTHVDVLNMLTGINTNVLYTRDDKLWKKLKNSIKKNNLITCSANDSKNINKKMKINGVIDSALYLILDIAEIKLENGEIEQLLKIKNPWKNLEWNGDWSDKSNKWTDDLKKQFNLDIKDDGIFWINKKDFISNFESIYINKIEENIFYNGLECIDKNKTISKLFIEKDTDIEITINQFDKQNYDENHEYCYYRVNLVQLKKDKLEFIKSKLSDTKLINLKLNLKKGNYLLLIQKYDSKSYKQSFNISIKSKKIVNIQDITDETELFNTVEYWTYKNQEYSDYTEDIKNYDTFNIKTVCQKSILESYYQILEVRNLDKKSSFVVHASIQSIKGYEIVNTITANSIYLNLEKNKKNIILLKLNPYIEENYFNFNFENNGIIMYNDESEKVLYEYLNSINFIKDPKFKYYIEVEEASCKCNIY